MSLMLGVDKRIITPKKPLFLAGYADRHEKYEAILHDLYIRTFYLKQGDQEKYIIQGDLIWWGRDFIDDIRIELQRELGLRAEDLLFTATHTHSGPQTSYVFTPALGKPDQEYILFLKKTVKEALICVTNNIEEVVAEHGKGASSIGINRRVLVNGLVEMRPNPTGIIDRDFNLILFRRKKDNCLMGSFIQISCHANVTGDNVVSADYPGVTISRLEKEYNCVAGFLQGFTGDVRPAQILGNRFFRGTEKEVQIIADIFYKEIKEVMKKGCEIIRPKLDSRLEKATLSFARTPTLGQLEESRKKKGIEGEWSRFLMDHQELLVDDHSLEIFRLDLSNECKIVALNGEIVTEYGRYLKNKYGHNIIPVGYANGMIGYIPTKQQLEEGGYEPVESIYYFALPSQFDNHIEENIKEALDKTMQ